MWNNWWVFVWLIHDAPGLSRPLKWKRERSSDLNLMNLFHMNTDSFPHMQTESCSECVCLWWNNLSSTLPVKRRLAAVLSTVCCTPSSRRFRTRRRLFGAPPDQLVHGIKLLMANYHPINLCKCWAFVKSLHCKKCHGFSKWNACSSCVSRGSSPHSRTRFNAAKTLCGGTVTSDMRCSADWRRKNTTDCLPSSDVIMRDISFKELPVFSTMSIYDSAWEIFIISTGHLKHPRHPRKLEIL